ncbi:MAG: 5'/3'-nucleotidase SurE [bacterium]|nr:5'/3'-nucleotidase SurE [bacterium]
MRILLTNDDGILAPGIDALFQALADLGEVVVVAPERSHSGAGHALTVQAPVAVQRVRIRDEFGGWAISGGPADCVKLAMLELLDQPPDFVVSGINGGINTGVFQRYSGTVAAAAESAIFFGVPSMAISLEVSEVMRYERAGAVARRIFETYTAGSPPVGSCVNVNIPALDSGWPRGVRVRPQSVVPVGARYRRQTDAGGRKLYWLEGALPEREDHVDTDTGAVLDGYVAITPLKFEVTDRELLASLSNWEWPERFE